MTTLFLVTLVLVLLIGFFAFPRQEVKKDFSCLKDIRLWSWQGEIGRSPYLILGLILFNVKLILDKVVFYAAFGDLHGWNPYSYLYPLQYIGREEITNTDLWFVFALFLIALPFIYFGVGLTIRRLRALKLPLWLSAFFFVPFINALFFMIIGMLPAQVNTAASGAGKTARHILDRIIPDSAVGSAIAAVLVNSVISVIGLWLGVNIFKNYGISLFVAGPFVLGLIAALIYGYHEPRTMRNCVWVGCLSILVAAAVTLTAAIEGFICIFMVLPIGILMAVFGAWVGYYIQRRPSSQTDAATMIILLVAAMPFLMGFERSLKLKPEVFAVKTHVDVDAPVGTVWKNVVEFPQLPEPTELLFKAGISYPTHAEIVGEGVGAVRYCNFSTGSFVEPITAWEENRRLAFDVVDQPRPMTELSPYKIDAPHLDGYMNSRRGQFLLKELPDGKVRLEGTTWYTNAMWPAGYWKLWSDYIIHKIHHRVLDHIRDISERPLENL